VLLATNRFAAVQYGFVQLRPLGGLQIPHPDADGVVTFNPRNIIYNISTCSMGVAMNTTYMAALLTPVLTVLLQKIGAEWFHDPTEAPPILIRAGSIGRLYLVSSAAVSIGSYLSLIGLLVFGTASAMYTIGMLCIGCVCAGVWLALFGRSLWLNNLITHVLLTLNLVVVHWIAWANQ